MLHEKRRSSQASYCKVSREKTFSEIRHPNGYYESISVKKRFPCPFYPGLPANETNHSLIFYISILLANTNTPEQSIEMDAYPTA